MKSVLQDWVMELPLREQGTLMTNIRSCDVSPKTPCDINERYGCSTGEGSAERKLTAYLRFLVFNPPDPREIDIPGSFYSSSPPTDWKPSQFGHYPMHWYAHLMHGFEVLAFRHSNPNVQDAAYEIYSRMVHAMHLNVETKAQMIKRLSEDRIASGKVVS